MIPCLSPLMSDDVRDRLALVLARHRAGEFGVFASVRECDLELAGVILGEFDVSVKCSTEHTC